MDETTLKNWLRRYRTAWWRYRLLRTVIRGVPVFASLTTIAILLELLFHFPVPIRWFISGLLLTGLTVTVSLLFWQLRQLYQNQSPNDSELAKTFARHPLGHGRLLNAIELQSDPSPLAQYAISITTNELSTVEPQVLFPFPIVKKSLLRTTAIVVLVFAVPLLFSSSRDAIARLLLPNRSFLPAAPYQLLWTNDAVDSYARGEPITLSLKIEPVTATTLPETGEFEVEFVSQQKRKQLPFRFENQAAQFKLEDASGEIAVTPRVGSIIGKKLKLTPFQRVRIENSTLTVIPPGYSGLPPREASLGDLAVLAGSKLVWNGRATADIGTLFLLFRHSNGVDTFGVKSSGKAVSTTIPIKTGGQVQFVLTDDRGRAGSAPASFQVELLPDESPRVLLLAPEKDDALPGTFRLPVIARADDDFGIGRMYLCFRLLKNQQTSTWDSLAIQPQAIPPASAGAAVQWDLSQYDLLPDDGVEFYVSAFDENIVTGPGRGVSEIRHMKVPSLEQWLTETETANEAIGSELEALSKSGERVAQSLEQLAERMKRKGQLSHEDKEQARAAAEKQNELVKRAEAAAKELRELSKKMEESGAAARETMEKLSRLQELMQELASPELKDALQKLQEALKKMDQQQIKAAMDRVQLDQKEWKEKLDRTVALLEQIRLERRMDLLEQWSKKVAEQSRRNEMAIDSLQNQSAASDSLSREQSKLANDSKALEEQVAQTADDVAKNPQLGEQ
ncbi:MAG: hypothetical protein OEM52_14150, partial [bacterium]|nr:hypothetical protein [bacterium]